MSYYDILLAKQLSGGGGGGDITVESLSVTANGIYSAPSGKAYSPVTVNVPNPSTGTKTITSNGTYDVTAFAEALVNIAGGGLDYESGVWEPGTNKANEWISLSNTHSTPPAVVCICIRPPESIPNKTYLCEVYVNYDRMFGSGALVGNYGVGYAIYSGSSAGTVSNTHVEITTSDTTSTETTTSNSRYWAQESKIRAAAVMSGYYWRNQTYDWYAIWF